MGDHADELTELMLDMKALHDIGECDESCDWCREEEWEQCMRDDEETRKEFDK